MGATQVSPETRKQLAIRSGGICERCGEESATQAHHRQPRGIGGTRLKSPHSLSNLLHLGNQCHDWVESERNKARLLVHGWLVDQHQDPRTVPALIYSSNFVGAQLCILSDDGCISLWADGEVA